MEKTFCPECGPAEVPHFLTKSNQTVGLFAEVFAYPIRPLVHLVMRLTENQVDGLTYLLMYILAGIGVVKLKSEPSSEKDTDRAKCMWKAAKERGIEVKQVWAFKKPINIFLAKLPNGKRLIFEGLPRPGGDSVNLEWMDNKGTMKLKFRAAGFPVPRGETCYTLTGGKKVFNEIRKNGGMVVVKPTLGSRSRHTRVHIKTEEEFIKAFKIAKQICPIVSVEEELRGSVFRVALIGGQLGGVLRRDPAIITGNGKNNVRELIAMENRDPRRNGVFHAIPINSELDEALALQKMNRESVPKAGQRVIAGTKVGRSQGGTNSDVTDEVHIENRKLFLDIAEYLKDPLVGIDFIIEDITKPWRGQMPCGSIELNTIPFLDLHIYPYEGKARDLSSMLWDEVLRVS
jgi:D-alanine-D-alanine ligase-like ATP-grasp enzyme